jgi:Asp-tRNA(Asn)/Glu-tRNA(Gln) amidotransferase A subunit family amidase
MEASIEDVRQGLALGQITCRQLVKLYLDRIDAFDDAGPALNAVQTVNPRALDEADALDAAWRTSGARGPLHCIPALVKDQIETRDMPTSYGSALFSDFIPHRDATVVTRLRAAGALILGKTTMGEFANSYIGSAFGVVRNAYDPRRTASGSSGGTGASIAANFAVIGIGEDTGGSTRGPAAFGSLVGVRPTVPLVSRHGVFPATPTRDTLGPITRSVRDAAIVLDVIAGYDPDDAMTAYAFGHVPSSYAAQLDANALSGARIGVVRQPMSACTDPASDDYKKVRIVIDRALADLARLGAHLVDPLPVPQRQTDARAETAGEKPPRRVTVLGATGAGSFETSRRLTRISRSTRTPRPRRFVRSCSRARSRRAAPASSWAPSAAPRAIRGTCRRCLMPRPRGRPG